jgi:tetratricopeptide (TPR) repeat protein
LLWNVNPRGLSFDDDHGVTMSLLLNRTTSTPMSSPSYNYITGSTETTTPEILQQGPCPESFFINQTNDKCEKRSSPISSTPTQILTETAEEYFNEGLLQSKRENYTKAIENFDKALDIDPNNALALNKKGLALYNLSKYQEAITWFDKVLEIDPGHVNALYNKGLALGSLSKFQAAITWFDKVLEIDPNYFDALYSKGAALGGLGKYDEAITWYDKALAIDPSNFDVLLSKGIALGSLGKYDETIIWIDKALVIDPSDVDALNIKGYALYTLGQYQEAITWFDKALAIDPNHVGARDNKALALSELEQAQTTNDFKLYQNSNYKLSIQFPSDWTINEINWKPSDYVTHVVSFLSPLEDSSDLFYENLLIGIHNLNYNNANLREFLNKITSSLIAGWKNLKIIDSNTGSNLAGNPAYKLEATYTQTQGNENEYDDIDVKMMEIGTIVDNKVYYVHYSAEPEKYDRYLPVIQKMVKSLTLDNYQEQ